MAHMPLCWIYRCGLIFPVMRAHAQCNLSAIITVVYMSFNLNLKKQNTPELKINGVFDDKCSYVHVVPRVIFLFELKKKKKKKKKNKTRNK